MSNSTGGKIALVKRRDSQFVLLLLHMAAFYSPHLNFFSKLGASYYLETHSSMYKSKSSQSYWGNNQFISNCRICTGTRENYECYVLNGLWMAGPLSGLSSQIIILRPAFQENGRLFALVHAGRGKLSVLKSIASQEAPATACKLQQLPLPLPLLLLAVILVRDLNARHSQAIPHSLQGQTWR